MRHLPMKNGISEHLAHFVASMSICCLGEYRMGRKQKWPVTCGYWDTKELERAATYNMGITMLGSPNLKLQSKSLRLLWVRLQES